MGASRVVDGKLDLTQNTVAITYLSYTSRNALLAPLLVMVVYTVYLTRNFMKSNNSVEILCGFRKASVQLTVELQYYFSSVSPISAEGYFAVCGFVRTQLTSSFFVQCLYCQRSWCISFAQVATYVH